jgi:putative nucleotidyltransferase with HDIG domain
MENAQQAFVAMVRALEAKDAYTHGHSERVAILTSRLASAIGLSEEIQDRLLQAGMLHDLGKIAVKESILHKPSQLTDEEFAHIKSHPVVGEEILQYLKFAQKLLPAVRHHHENFTGGGYPDGIAGEEIPLDARLMAVADSYDAMTSNRPYRDGMSSRQALNILTEDKLGQWQPDLVEGFVGVV